ncbi:helix-turn-helix domain-containing protein [Streptomyces corynorhini]|uniref:XRE family transcriptional regulator n=1 Tax=Streptomyces corynorhini TaxID=2282652 RepID=A0A370B5J3_9ACTN|nr:helix-turn-helix transcriptional regulator [Streptomyces corynorhini]RDG35932.1 XRE family transcriptional regulator [Streptomyces corynorhini]
MRSVRSSGITTVHEARSALGQRLRELRQQAGLSGRQLAESLSWAPSKVSKLENGRQTPTAEDIREWTRSTASEDQSETLLTSLHTLDLQYAEWQRQLKTGFASHQNTIAHLDERTRFFRAFEPTVVPGLLQTAGYARERFTQGATTLKVPHDVDEAVRVRTQRHEILYRPDKRFHFVLTEAALRYRLCATEVMLGQLDRLVSLSTLPNVKLGIIAFSTRYTVAPWHGFWILDHDRVMVETYSAELNLAQPSEVKLYGTAFEQLAAVATYGRAARALITQISDGLSAEVSQVSEDSE